MSVTTKTGDDGKSRWMGKVVEKDSELLEAIGEVDELMAVMAVVAKNIEGIEKIREAINNDLYKISGYLAGCSEKIDLENSIKLIEADTKRMEGELDSVREFLKAGKELNVWLNWARTVARRAERRVVKLNKVEKVDKNILVFMNRLSDYLFILSRAIR